MKEWLTAREIAEERLPNIPQTERGIQLLADAESWNGHPYARKRSGRGGGMEYRYLLLPVAAQVAYVQRHGRIGSDPVKLPEHLDREPKTEAERLQRDARVTILAAFDDFHKGVKVRGRPLSTALYQFCHKYNDRSLHVEAWVRNAVPHVSSRSIMRWRSERKAGKVSDLGFDRAKARKGKGLLETANGGKVRAFILAWLTDKPALSAETVRGYVEDEFGAELIDRNGELKPLPPKRTFQHFIKQLKAENTVVMTAVNNPDKFRSTMKLVGTGTLRHVREPNALWQIDASPVDALCVDGRYSMYACIDIATRRTVITISKTPRASAVALLIRKAISKWGIPQAIKTDNGSDFVATSTKRLFSSLGIEMDVSEAYSPAQKGHVERVIKTFQHDVCPQLPGYVGHNVAERKAIEERKSFSARLGADEQELFEVELTAPELQAHVDAWIEYVYCEREHSALKMSPNDAALSSAAPIRRVDERALDALLMPVAGKDGRRKMTKQGIRIDGFYYVAGSIMVGTELFCRQDPIDMGKVYAFDAEDGSFLDVAICPEIAGIDPRAYVKAQQEIAKQLVDDGAKQVKADIRALKKGPSGIERTLRLARRKHDEKATEQANIINLPKRSSEHTTPDVSAAIDAMTLPARDKMPKPLNDKARELHEQITREAERRGESKVLHINPDDALTDGARMFKWAMAQEDLISRGEVLDDATAGKLMRFKASAEYRTRKDIADDFGMEAALRF
ncbi:MAG: transposase [Martelella sp.]|uniref:transposase n=1 Tax=Martelella sp. TaxID=1969699 RepID=UPI0032422E81